MLTKKSWWDSVTSTYMYCAILDALRCPAWLPTTSEGHESLVVPATSAGLAHGVQDSI